MKTELNEIFPVGVENYKTGAWLNGWRGNFCKGYNVPETARRIREALKANGIKGVTIASPHHEIRFTITASPEDVKSDQLRIWDGKINVNHYHLYQYKDHFSPALMKKLLDIYQIACAFNYDCSDIMTDYFDTLFYVSLIVKIKGGEK